jgi:hypothetical protein
MRKGLRMPRSRLLGKPLCGLVFVLGLLASPRPASAIKVAGDEDTNIALNYLLQPWGQFTYDKDHSTKTTDDIFVRRSRLIVQGQITKWVSYFMETEQANWGKGGDWSASAAMFVQDAFVRFNFSQHFMLSVGMLLPAFARNFFTSAAAMHIMDYHSALAKYPSVGATATSPAWRDMGVQLSGLFAKQKLEYRLSLTNGQSERLWSGIRDDMDDTTRTPRVTGRVSYNFFDPEVGFFPAGTYLGKKKVLSVGVAFDAQRNGVAFHSNKTATANPLTGMANYYGIAGDVFWDLPLGRNRFTGALGWLYYGGSGKDRVGTATTDSDADNPTAGTGVYLDVGYAIGKWEPMLSFDYFSPKSGETFDDQFVGIHPALAFWGLGHNANVKLDFGILKYGKLDTAAQQGPRAFGHSVLQVTVQTQLFF